MTDKEIIKALELKKYSGHSCVNCKYGSTKGEYRCGLKGCNIARNALDLIKKQQAEIERLQKVQINYTKAYLDEFVERLKVDCSLASLNTELLNEVIDELVETMNIEFNRFTDFTDLIKAEAIKEFAERLKGEFVIFQYVSYSVYSKIISIIDNLVKEMVGEQDGT